MNQHGDTRWSICGTKYQGKLPSRTQKSCFPAAEICNPKDVALSVLSSPAPPTPGKVFLYVLQFYYRHSIFKFTNLPSKLHSLDTDKVTKWTTETFPATALSSGTHQSNRNWTIPVCIFKNYAWEAFTLPAKILLYLFLTWNYFESNTYQCNDRMHLQHDVRFSTFAVDLWENVKHILYFHTHILTQ
jgi:hypothetical protein